MPLFLLLLLHTTCKLIKVSIAFMLVLFFFTASFFSLLSAQTSLSFLGTQAQISLLRCSLFSDYWPFSFFFSFFLWSVNGESVGDSTFMRIFHLRLYLNRDRVEDEGKFIGLGEGGKEGGHSSTLSRLIYIFYSIQIFILGVLKISTNCKNWLIYIILHQYA